MDLHKKNRTVLALATVYAILYELQHIAQAQMNYLVSSHNVLVLILILTRRP